MRRTGRVGVVALSTLIMQRYCIDPTAVAYRRCCIVGGWLLWRAWVAVWDHGDICTSGETAGFACRYFEYTELLMRPSTVFYFIFFAVCKRKKEISFAFFLLFGVSCVFFMLTFFVIFLYLVQKVASFVIFAYKSAAFGSKTVLVLNFWKR